MTRITQFINQNLENSKTVKVKMLEQKLTTLKD